jgi:hypothetical protein
MPRATATTTAATVFALSMGSLVANQRSSFEKLVASRRRATVMPSEEAHSDMDLQVVRGGHLQQS